MSGGADLIDPDGIPHFIGDLSTLDMDVMLLSANAAQFRASGGNVHTLFQGLAAFYRAPEAPDLFATTLPVKTKADEFAGDLEQVAQALSDYSFTVQPLIEKLAVLKADATAFVNSVAGDGDWRKDQDKVDRNNELWRDVNHTVAAFQAAELACHNKITALVGGTVLTVDDGTHGPDMYGYRAEDLDQAGATPWGAPVEREREGVDWLLHEGKQVWDGVWEDGVIGTYHGLKTLVGGDGWDAAGQAWKSLAQVGTASVLTSATLGTWWLVPADKLPSWLRDSRTAYKETVKGFVAYDQWQTNPSRAAGHVSFNVLTTIAGTEGAGAAATAAGRTGAGARALSAASKVGKAIDPFTYVGKAGEVAFVKVGDTFRVLKDLHSGDALNRLQQADALRPPRVPDNAIPLLDEATGKTVYLVEEGHLLNADGTIHQYKDQAPVENSAAERAVPTEAGARQPELVGGARSTDATAHAGESQPAPRAGHDIAADSGGTSGYTGSTHSESGTGAAHDTGSGGGSDHPASGHADATSGHGSPGSDEIRPDVHGGNSAGGPSGGGGPEGQAPRQGESGPMELGGEAEQRLREGIRSIPRNTMKPKVLERIVARLGEHPFGSEIAEIISSGHFSQSPGFRELVSTLGSGNLHAVPRAVDQLRLGEQFHRSGLRDISFEQKNASIKADIDVRVVDEAGESWGYQLKRLDNPRNPFENITKADNLGQLSKSNVDQRIMLVDAQGTIAEWEARGIPEELLQVNRGEHSVKSEKGRGILFVIRLEDGTIVIPPGSKVDPRGVL
ncbi:hypothetical protein [Streptomyces sp. NPDC018693]|uniref:hypothetical protein n=1 Tax=unclassified Streptomyces TaxID=2593676 RepID=UPI0037B3C2F0